MEPVPDAGPPAPTAAHADPVLEGRRLVAGVARVPGGAIVRLYGHLGRGDTDLRPYLGLISLAAAGGTVQIDARSVGEINRAGTESILDLQRQLEATGFEVQVDFGDAHPDA